jgi:hypothetical protein
MNFKMRYTERASQSCLQPKGCMRSLSLLYVAAAVMLCAGAVRVSAQEPEPAPAHIAFVQGSVTVEHGGEREPASINMPVVEGDRIVTGADGRADVMFPDGSSIAIDPASDVEFIGAARVRVIAGAIEHRPAAVDPQSPSSQYLPPDLQPYGPDLDQNGAWQYDAQYGNVWYPTVVAADWRPYYDGYWYSAPSYGWTWVSAARWGWPTHHYGRWGYARNRWFWIPGRTYAAAWVSWGTAPDYVSWCPLGWDGRPVFGLSLTSRYTWNAWTVVRRDHFGSRRYSPRAYHVDGYRLAANTAFIEHRTPPSRDRHGTFSVGGRDAGGINRRPSTAGSVGVAVPRDAVRGDNRGRRMDQIRRTDQVRGAERTESPATAAQPIDRTQAGTPFPYGRERRSADSVTDGQRRTTTDRGRTTNDQRPSTNDQRPSTNDQRPSTNDHPVFRPHYAPRYEPRGDAGRSRAPAAAPEPARAQPREAPRASAPAPSAPRASSPPPSSGRPSSHDGGPPPRARSPEGRSGGSAVRRPR